MVYYHVTPTRNVSQIMTQGLKLPYKYVSDLNPAEQQEYLRIYLFKQRLDAEHGTGKSGSHTLLKVHLPSTIKVYVDNMSPNASAKALFVRSNIAPKYLTNLGVIERI
jgi:hypothetical protein